MSSLKEVSVVRLGLDSGTNSYVVILREKGGERFLPIWIGQPEAESILLEMNNQKKERPLTHDLCRNLILGLGGELRSVHITRVQKGVYYAEMHIARGEKLYSIDARPSDSIAVALRFPAPIFAEEGLLADAGESGDDDDSDAVVPEPEPLQSTDEMNAEQLKEYLSRLRPEDFGKFTL